MSATASAKASPEPVVSEELLRIARETRAMESSEPLLSDEGDPFESDGANPDIEKCYDSQFANIWPAKSVDLTEDHRQMPVMSADEKHLLAKTAIFIQLFDQRVIKNINTNFMDRIRNEAALRCYSLQAMIEHVHVVVYKNIARMLLPTAVERMEAMKFAETPGSSINMLMQWIDKWSAPHLPFCQHLYTYILLEGLMFTGIFAIFRYFRHMGKLPGSAHANELIMRDETAHKDFGVTLMRRLRRPIDQFTARLMTEEAVACMDRFAYDMLIRRASGKTTIEATDTPLALPGMSLATMKQHVRYVADQLLTDDMGFNRIYQVSDPFHWRLTASMVAHVNGFERRTGDYSVGQVGNTLLRQNIDKFEVNFNV